MIGRIRKFIQDLQDSFNLWLLGWLIRNNIDKPEVIYDIGCGERPQPFLNPSLAYVMIDPQNPPIQKNETRDKIIYVTKRGSWDDALNDIVETTTHVSNAVFLVDVIEHLEKPRARFLLEELEQIADQIVIITRRGFRQQHDGEFNTHRSGWYPDDFNTEGWTVGILKNFYHVDFKGQELSHPYDAILAIYKRCRKYEVPD
jgi:hypothetical protein